MAALLRPSSGRVLFRGRDVWLLSKEEFREYRRSVQIVYQDPYGSLNPMLTVFGTLSAPLGHGLATRRNVCERVAELLEVVGLAPPRSS